ncbi:serine/threonine protein kinase [Podila verticillata NRRL 6337]|nr:serine/threonine protein kinase [Podila verticillata NRRL 6337]
MYGQERTPEQKRQLYASFYQDAASVNMDTMPSLTHSLDTDDMDMNSKPPEAHVRNIQTYGRVLQRDQALRQEQQDHRIAERHQQLEYNQKHLQQSHNPSQYHQQLYHQQQRYQQQYQQQQYQQQQQFYYQQQQQQQQQPQSRQQRQQEQQRQQQQQQQHHQQQQQHHHQQQQQHHHQQQQQHHHQQQQQHHHQQQQQHHHQQPTQKPSYTPTEDSSAMPSLTFSEDHTSSPLMPSFERQHQQQHHQQPTQKPTYTPTEDSSAMPSLAFSEDHSSSSSMLSSGPGAIPEKLALPPQNQPERGVDNNEFFLTSILDMINNTPPGTGPGSLSMIPHFDYQSSFTERQRIAKGGNGEVRRAFWPMQHCYVILKSLIDTKHSAAKLAVLFDKEVEVMNRCGNHDNLAQFYGIATKPTEPGSPSSPPSDSLEPERFMVMQYYEHGDLVHVLSKPEILAEAPTLIDKLYLAMDIAAGLDHLFKCGFHHGDLHPKNILVDSRHNAMYSSNNPGSGRYLARLTDFGLRRIRDNTNDVSSQQFGGVWQFMAPERMVRNRPRYNVRCDIFALGVIYWQIMSGRYPFKDPSKWEPGAREPRPEGVPDWYYAVYTQAWRENPLERQQDLEEIVAVFKHHLLTSGSKSLNPNHPRYKKSHVPGGMLGRMNR